MEQGVVVSSLWRLIFDSKNFKMMLINDGDTTHSLTHSLTHRVELSCPACMYAR